MHSSQAELVWQGRIHLGDEPGVYGDAEYSGLAMELPLTLAKTDPNGPDTTTLRLRTQDVATFGGYPGHAVTVILYEEDQPNHFTETVLSSALLTSAANNKIDVPIDFSGAALPARVSVRVRVDTEVPPGLYDDFVVVRLENKSPQFTFVASLGFTA